MCRKEPCLTLGMFESSIFFSVRLHYDMAILVPCIGAAPFNLSVRKGFKEIKRRTPFDVNKRF